MQGHSGVLHTEESSGVPALQTFLVPSFLFLSLGAQEVLFQAELLWGALCVELALSEPSEILAVPRGLTFTGLVSLTVLSSPPPL